MIRIIDDPVPHDLGAMWDWCVLQFGFECGRMTEAELIEASNNEHDPATDVAWLELERRRRLEAE